MNKLIINDLELNSKHVLMRVDFNVPLDDNLNVLDDTRIRKVLPTIEYILSKGASLTLLSHLGRPKGSVITEMSLKTVAEHLSRLLMKPVDFVSDCIGPETVDKNAKLIPGQVLLLENLRFHKEETENDSEFAEILAKFGDVYVNDAFGTAHRAHASTEGVTRFFDLCAAGFLMEKEINYLTNAVENPNRPLAAIIGGAKISGKIDAIQNLLAKVDVLLIGGGMAFTFFKALRYEIGNSILEEDRIEIAKDILRQTEKEGRDLVLPIDVLTTDHLDNTSNLQIMNANSMTPEIIGVDIGPGSIALFREKLVNVKTVVWNGPMGIFEQPEFAKGTFEIAKILSTLTKKGALTIVGGGDSVAAINQCGFQDSITHISTGGGASLELLSGYELPGLAALTDKRN